MPRLAFRDFQGFSYLARLRSDGPQKVFRSFARQLSQNTMRLPRLYLITAAAFLLGCEEDPASPHPEAVSISQATVRSAAARSQEGLDTVNPHVRLSYNRSKMYRDQVTITDAAIAQAIFTNHTIGVDVNSVTVQGNSLYHQGSGRYDKVNAVYSNASDLIWNVTGYEGTSFADTSANVREILLSIKPGDTLSKSQDVTVTYAGNDGGDLDVTLSFDYGLTYAFVDTAVANDSASQFALKRTETDDGSITFTTSDLSGFTANTYVYLSIAHWVYHVRTLSNGRFVGVWRIHTTSIPLFLKP